MAILGAIILTIAILLLGLYVQVFVFGKKRKRIAFDAGYEKVREENYPPSFPDGWFSLCSAHRVKKGKAIEVDAFGHKYAVYRGEDGGIGVMDAYCPHLNANLAFGKVKGNNLECPFHGWQFNKHGQCSHIPYTDKLPHYEPKQYHFKEEWGMILLWRHSQGLAPTWQTNGLIKELETYKFHTRTSELLRIHLQDFAENGSDFAHFNFVHNLITIPFARRFVDVKHTVKLEFGEDDLIHTAQFSDQADLVWRHTGKMIPHAGGHATVTFYGPGFLVFRFTTKLGNMLLIKTFTPLGPLRVRMEDHIYAPRFTFPLSIKYLMGEAGAQFIDDINIWERKNFAIKPLLVRGDGPIMKMRAWYSQFYSAPKLQPKPQKHKEEVHEELLYNI
jgi:phenylpropionate dioxygenase-like ring-hydroxylating dioxygenase large terminal subunit